jgi:F-type H+-transporting ATPase subunit gamma
MPSLKDLKTGSRREGDAEDHQGHADGGRGEAAPRAGRGRRLRARMPNAWLRFWPTCRPAWKAVRMRSPLMAGTGKDDVHLLVVCTAERGLCGGFNGNIAKLAREHTDRLVAQGKTVKIVCVGKKGYDVLRRKYNHLIVDRVDLREVKYVGYGNAQAIASKVLGMFDEGEFDVATLFYSAFKSVISQVPTAQQIIPANVAGGEDSESAAADLGGAVYDYEPEESEILEELLPRNIAVQIFRALLENAASEQGARMSAMDNATRNAGEMIDKLTLSYNRQRQAQITKELIEIISGAEAL